jgi:hypothetical protein
VISFRTRWEAATAATPRPRAPPLGESFLRVHWVAVPKALRARRPNRVTSLYPEPGQTSNTDLFRSYKFVLAMENSNTPGYGGGAMNSLAEGC